MKKAFLSLLAAGGMLAATAQSQLDTFKLYNNKTPSAWSRQPDTVTGKRQQPISGQPANSAVPAPLTDPINNPTSGQTNPTPSAPPVDVPPMNYNTPAKPIQPLRKNPKPANYDTLPGTNRNG